MNFFNIENLSSFEELRKLFSKSKSIEKLLHAATGASGMLTPIKISETKNEVQTIVEFAERYIEIVSLLLSVD